jgi:hypothetical protein
MKNAFGVFDVCCRVCDHWRWRVCRDLVYVSMAKWANLLHPVSPWEWMEIICSINCAISKSLTFNAPECIEIMIEFDLCFCCTYNRLKQLHTVVSLRNLVPWRRRCFSCLYKHLVAYVLLTLEWAIWKHFTLFWCVLPLVHSCWSQCIRLLAVLLPPLCGTQGRG